MASKKLIFLLFLFFLPCLGFAEQSTVSKTVLENGMTVLIQEMPLSPITSVYACIKTGSAIENGNMGRGISHFVEHMLFKGTNKRPVGSIAKEVKSLGGSINASTSRDYTIYTIDIPSESADKAIDILSDMLMNSVFDAVEMEKERQVIHGEMRLYNDKPERFFADMVYQNIFKAHPYKFPIIGYPKLFDSITREDLFKYFKERYIPNNIIFSVAGNVQKEKILPIITESFKDFKPAAYVERNISQEPEQALQRYSEGDYATELFYFSLAYQGLSITDPDLYALDVLSMALGQGESSRIYREAYKNKHWVETISASNFTPQDRGYFEIYGTMSSDHLSDLLSLVSTMCLHIQKNGLESIELEKTKRQVLAGYIFGRQTSSSLASQAAVEEAMIGDADFSRHYVQEIKKVTNEDIKRVAKKYLQDSRLSVTLMKPRSKLNTIPKKAIKTEEQGIKKVVLENGLIILLHEDHNVPLVSVKMMMRGGIKMEDPKLAGLADLTGYVWGQATKHLSEDQLVLAMEQRGGSLSTWHDYESMGLSMDILSEDLDFALNLMEDVIKDPAMPIDIMERQKKAMLVTLQERQDDIMQHSLRVLYETLYLKHPIRLDSLGNKETLSKITRQDLLDFYHRFLYPNNMVISVFGDIDSTKVIEVLKVKYGSLKKGDVQITEFHEDAPLSTRENNLQMDKEQALVLFALQAPLLKSPDRFAFMTLNAILGSGLSGRLFTKIREELGQAYTTNSSYLFNSDSGTFMVYVLTTPDKVDSVKQIVNKELEKLKAQDVNNEEFQNAKSYLKGSLKRSLLTVSNLASKVTMDELNRLGFDYYQSFDQKIDQVSVEDIKRIARVYLDLSKAAIVITKPITAKNISHE